MAAQLIGFVGADDRGLTGIEMILDSEIKGDLEELKITTDKQNIPILGSVLERCYLIRNGLSALQSIAQFNILPNGASMVS